eukprot:scaffold253430_cov38-Prasinocladus_malaysianus.AAC.1
MPPFHNNHFKFQETAMTSSLLNARLKYHVKQIIDLWNGHTLHGVKRAMLRHYERYEEGKSISYVSNGRHACR